MLQENMRMWGGAMALLFLFVAFPMFSPAADLKSSSTASTPSESAPSVPKPKSPLEARINIRLNNGLLQSYHDEIALQTELRFKLVEGLELCRVTAFLRNVPAREALQLLVGVKNLTYQQLGGQPYIVSQKLDAPACPRSIAARKPAGFCRVVIGATPINVQCKDASLSEFIERVFDQSDANFIINDGAEDDPITIDLDGASLDEAIKKLDHESITVKRHKSQPGVYIVTPIRKRK